MVEGYDDFAPAASVTPFGSGPLAHYPPFNAADVA